MFCPNNEVLQNFTEKTKLLAQKCSKQIRTTMDSSSASGQQVSSFKSYISESEHATNVNVDTPISTINCLTANLTSLNRLIKERCSFISATSYTCNTLPKLRPQRGTTKWYIKVSLYANVSVRDNRFLIFTLYSYV
jgi:hypothetical protein